MIKNWVYVEIGYQTQVLLLHPYLTPVINLNEEDWIKKHQEDKLHAGVHSKWTVISGLQLI